MDRRSFLKGVLTAAVVPALPQLGVALPKIVGDGVHDDTAGLQALFDGEPFMVEGENVIACGGGQVVGGIFRLTRMLTVTGGSLLNCEIIADHDDTILMVREHGFVDSVWFRRGGSDPDPQWPFWGSDV